MNLLPDKAIETRSITRQLTVRLIITVLIVSALAVTAMHLVVSHAAIKGLEQKADETLAYLVGTLDLPLWAVDEEGVKTIGKAVSHDESIARLIIRNEAGAVIFSIEKEKSGDLIHRSGQIIHKQWRQEKRAGDVSVSLTPAIYNQSNQRLLFFSMVIIVLILIAVVIVTAVSIRTSLNKPLKSLGELANQFASGRYDTSGHGLPYLEFQPFSSALAGMASQIEEQICMARKREEDIRTLNAGLEQRVTERTALLLQKTGELEQAYERLKEVDRLKSSFIAAMSHELRTPLNSVIGFSSVMLNEWLGPVNDEQKQNLASILGSGRHLLAMINDLLDVTQIESDMFRPVIKEFDLHDLLAEAESQIATVIQEKGLELHSEVTHQLMCTDRQRLLQCVLNILNNALKYTDRGRVTVEAHIISAPGETPEADLVEIAVTDTGIGISEEDLTKIFMPFSRIVTPGRAVVPGTGIGLFLTRKIATEILKGDIAVSSEQGKGSRFSLRIPTGCHV